MTPSEKHDFAALLTDVFAYYRQDCSAFTLEVFWNACQGFELEQIRKAVQAHCTDAEHGRFSPKVADLVRVLQGTVTDRAALAWGKVLAAMSDVGAYSDVVFDDGAIHAAIQDCGGWVKLCRSDVSSLGYLQHRFCQSYKAYAGRGNFEYPRCLIGDRSPDHAFALRGLKPPKPAVIGDIVAARSVYKKGSASGKVAISFTPIDAIEAGQITLVPDLPRRAA